MDPGALAGRLDDVQVVDVRHPNEWSAGRIDGAVHIPVDDLPERVDELDRHRPVVTVCRSGDRSRWAAEWLGGEGFDAESLDGGMQSWEAAGLRFTAEDGSRGTVADPEAPDDDRPPGMIELQDGFLEVVFAAQEHFGDREPTEEEMLGFLRDRLISEGRTPEEADEFLAGMGKD